MKPKDRQKMCTNCDGRVPFDSSECPYCGATQQPSAQPSEPLFTHQSLQDSLTSLYTPPYPAKNPMSPAQEEKKKTSFQEVIPEKKSAPSPVNVAALSEEDEAVGSFWPILSLSSGALVLLLGLLQVFFSDRGVLHLQWDSTYWFAYCLAGLPLLYYGLKKVNTLK